MKRYRLVPGPRHGEARLDVPRRRRWIALAGQSCHDADDHHIIQFKPGERGFGVDIQGRKPGEPGDSLIAVEVPVSGVAFIDGNTGDLDEADRSTRGGRPVVLRHERRGATEAIVLGTDKEDDQVAADEVAAIERLYDLGPSVAILATGAGGVVVRGGLRGDEVEGALAGKSTTCARRARCRD